MPSFENRKDFVDTIGPATMGEPIGVIAVDAADTVDPKEDDEVVDDDRSMERGFESWEGKTGAVALKGETAADAVLPVELRFSFLEAFKCSTSTLSWQFSNSRASTYSEADACCWLRDW